jgi:hypothetical protein
LAKHAFLFSLFSSEYEIVQPIVRSITAAEGTPSANRNISNHYSVIERLVEVA